MWHIGAALNIELTDPNVEKVTVFSRGLTDLPPEYKEKKIATGHPTFNSFYRKAKTTGTTSITLGQT
jgi:hypothetical protein